MTYRGRVKNGVIVLDPPAVLPEGEVVEILTAAPPEPATGGEQTRSLFEVLKNVIGKAEGLPEDISENHDHYLYGTPKR